MNLFATSCLIIIFPLLSQIILGTKSIYKSIKWNFNLLSVINILFELLSIFIAVKIVSADAINQNVRCGMPQMAIAFFGIIIIIALIVTIVIQLIVRKFINKTIEAEKTE